MRSAKKHIGIVSPASFIEHPDYKNNKDMQPIERLIAIRADSIAENGKIV